MAKRIKIPQALAKAKEAMQNYFKKHGLDPLQNYKKDPVHGETVTRLANQLNLERDKLDLAYPLFDLKNEVKLVKFRLMKKEKKTKKAQEAQEVEAKKKATKVEKGSKKGVEKKKEKEKSPKAVQSKYDYPKIDGREMTPDEKRKYRAAQRKANKDAGKGKAPAVTAEQKSKGNTKGKDAKKPKGKKKPSKED